LRGDLQGGLSRLLGSARAVSSRVFWLWPEHVDTLMLWQAVQTQWRMVSEIGATGLDYQGVRACPGFRGLPRARREQVFADLCVIERATLREWSEQREERRRAGG
jgi:hypothetical protein